MLVLSCQLWSDDPSRFLCGDAGEEGADIKR